MGKFRKKLSRIVDNVNRETTKGAKQAENFVRDTKHYVKHAVSDANERAQTCFELVSKDNIELCDNGSRTKILEITTQEISIGTPSAKNCLKRFQEIKIVECSTLPNIAKLCLEKLTAMGDPLCSTNTLKPVEHTTFSSLVFPFTELDPDFSYKCYNTLTGHSNEIVKCNTLGEL